MAFVLAVEKVCVGLPVLMLMTLTVMNVVPSIDARNVSVPFQSELVETKRAADPESSHGTSHVCPFAVNVLLADADMALLQN